MARHTEIVVMKVGDREQVVKVTVDAPYPDELDIQYLARRAWPMRSRRLRRGNVTVTVEETGR
jgi:hypothetical protein